MPKAPTGTASMFLFDGRGGKQLLCVAQSAWTVSCVRYRFVFIRLMLVGRAAAVAVTNTTKPFLLPRAFTPPLSAAPLAGPPFKGRSGEGRVGAPRS